MAMMPSMPWLWRVLYQVLCPEHERELVVGQLLEMVLCGR